jgi:hypothetical protein
MKPLPELGAPTGWSQTMRRSLAATQPAEPALRMMISADDGDRTVRLALDEISAVRVDDLAQVLDHRIHRSLGRTTHMVRFLHGRELRYACDHRGRLMELATVGPRSTVSDDGTVTFNSPRDGSQ